MNRLFAAQALLPSGWHDRVLLEWDSGGVLTSVTAEAAANDGVTRAAVVLPGMPNLHSHAFQRAMAGLTEFRANPSDSFWSWRSLMYAFAHKLSPPAMQAIAAQAYVEMLKAGYTSVCEFHYVHHDSGGKPYANPAEMAECLIAAAAETGIGLTLLPVLYQYSGFGDKAPLAEQARFINSPQWVLDLLQRLQRSHPQHAGLRYGVAPHSLRAVAPEGLRELLDGLRAWDEQAPVHLHIAEQTGEVEQCIAWLRARPVEWLLDNFGVDRHWCLVHATHMNHMETQALARSGAIAGICPSTEANLGDGFFNGVDYAAAGGAWGIGSDSNISIDMRDELRQYEYSQRLLRRQRNVLVGDDGASVGSYLYRRALKGGASAGARPVAGLAVGQRADLVVPDDTHPDLCYKRGDQLLDGLVFCDHAHSPLRDVVCGGRWVIRDGKHADEVAIAAGYRHALLGLLGN